MNAVAVAGAGAGAVIISAKSVRAAAFVLFDLSRLVSRPPLRGSDWSEPGRGGGAREEVGAGGAARAVINWDDLPARQSVRDKNILISPQPQPPPPLSLLSTWPGFRAKI